MNFVNHLLFNTNLLNYLFFNMFGSVFFFFKLGIYHGVHFDCITIINLRGYIDLLDTSVIVFVNNILWFVFYFCMLVELLVSSVICRFSGLVLFT